MTTPGGGMRLGIVVRESQDDAWLAAYQRLPLNRADRMLRTMARTAADVRWLAGLGAEDGPCWTGPDGRPYLVGDHATVAAEIARYIDAGCRTFILDGAAHADLVAIFARVSRMVTSERVR